MILKTAIYPGSFDPVTNGHLSIIIRAAGLFDRVIVAALKNNSKNPAFTETEKVEMINMVVKESGLTNVEVVAFSGLLADYCKEVGASYIVKGLRAMSDFEYEFQMALTNKKINPDVETVFLSTNSENMYLSSSIVKEVARYGGDISGFVPPCIEEKIKQKFYPKGE
jgi:pantetheine-phosphate adenylyltransferase